MAKKEKPPAEMPRRKFLGTLVASFGAGGVATEIVRRSLQSDAPTPPDGVLFGPSESPITEGSDLAKNCKVAMQREMAVTSGDELLLTGGVITCNAVFLVGRKSHIRAIAHFDTMYDGAKQDELITAQRIEQLMKLFPPDEPVSAYIKTGTWPLARETMLVENQITPDVAQKEFTSNLREFIKKGFKRYPNVTLDGVSQVYALNDRGNACGIDAKGRFYETDDIQFDLNISQQRLAEKSQRVNSPVTELKMAFDGRSEAQKRTINQAWAQRVAQKTP